jgi:hypothetical protein
MRQVVAAALMVVAVAVPSEHMVPLANARSVSEGALGGPTKACTDALTIMCSNKAETGKGSSFAKGGGAEVDYPEQRGLLQTSLPAASSHPK